MGISEDLLIVGDHFGCSYGEGSVYVFRFDEAQSQWNEIFEFYGGTGGPCVGWTVAIDRGMAITGAPAGIGAVYLFGGFHLRVAAELEDCRIGVGIHVAGDIAALERSDNTYLRIRSGPGVTAIEPDLADLIVGLTTDHLSPTALDLLVEHRASRAGTLKVRLRNWDTGQWEQVATATVTTADSELRVHCILAPAYLRATDGRIQVSLRQAAPFNPFAQGFDAFYDRLAVEVR